MINQRLYEILLKEYKIKIDDRELEIKDCSKGCDNNVYVVKLPHLVERIVVRIPKLINDDDCPVMHRPSMQASVMKKLSDNLLPVPSLIALDSESEDTYLIESYTPRYDLSQLFPIPYQMSTKHRESIYQQLGAILKKIHSIPTGGGFGSLIDLSLHGELNNWLDYFKDIPNQIADSNFDLTIHKQFSTVDQLKEHLLEWYNESTEYLKNYKQSQLVHADLCSNNIRVDITPNINIDQIDDNTNISIIGIIDFADAISGDGLYDLGRILSHVHGDWSFIESIEKTYTNNSTFTASEKNMIKFYAFSFCIWLLSISDTDYDLLKYNKILNNLLIK
ncbi:hypothetical protein DLAC_09327 [Tieghemostelium lacteum]|uniref:Aminoglycoside phosphotransferase domain-containing protein n=1 Tax=Tieghemostelium lacteum TaxID=361077 RepID=A0A151Z9S2_TIELA|nr:hypothetical protein DLAC_09327 [Tieghemostelium lacteum]|eukprot:KYQ90692.1 hypothetical protein DLAC_09327 [Tieghemostelium lacteum]